MKNKIILMCITLFLMCIGAKAKTPLPPSVTAYPATLSLRVDQIKELSLNISCEQGFWLEDGLKFEIEGDTTIARIKGIASSVLSWKTFNVYGMRQGTSEITITIKGYQRESSTGLRTEFAIKVKIMITVLWYE